MSTISTHVLDTARGKPADGVPLNLSEQTADGWRELGAGVTDADGRFKGLLPAGRTLTRGVYRMRFETDAYAMAKGFACFYPHVEVVFRVEAEDQHYHVPLLLSPFGFSTYRGS